MVTKKILFTAILGILISSVPLHAVSAATTKSTDYRGKILIQKESYNRLWYVNPTDGKRYYLRNGEMIFDVIRQLGTGISNKDIQKIALTKNAKSDSKLLTTFKGRFIIQVQNKGEAWYVNPTTGTRLYIKNPAEAYKILEELGTKVTDTQLKTVPMNNKQIVHDTTFEGIAHVRYDGTTFSKQYNADQILPMASLTKLMTALVLYDLSPDWDKKITITNDVLQYPKLYVGDDVTSEIPLALGDTISFQDLWIAMLVASSNQSAAALVNSTGLTVKEFVVKMNAKAKELGLTKTVFYDVAGLDAGNVTTPKEMAKIAAAAFSNGRLANDSVLRSHTIAAIDATGDPKAIGVTNRNYSLLQFDPTGAKTGYLVEARSTVAIQKNKEVFVVMHATGLAERNRVLGALLGSK